MFLNGYALHEEPCTDPYARFCGQTEASAPSDRIIIQRFIKKQIMRSLSRWLFESGIRTRRRDTFFCSAKRKYPKKRRLGCRFFLRSTVLSGVGREGFLPSYRRAASMPRPFGLIPTKPAVLGAANESIAILLRNVS